MDTRISPCVARLEVRAYSVTLFDSKAEANSTPISAPIGPPKANPKPPNIHLPRDMGIMN